MAFDHFQRRYADSVTPFAQVTVFDAKEGDCNLIDFCLDPDQPTTGASWFRTLVDTGVEGDNLKDTIVHVLKNMKLPGLTTGPLIPQTPRLEEMVITHLDDDHIGNARGVLLKMAYDYQNTPPPTGNDLIKQCNVVHHRIPQSLYPRPSWIDPTPVATTWEVINSEGKREGTPAYSLTFTPTFNTRLTGGIEGWTSEMKLAGFVPQFDWYTRDNKALRWGTNSAEWVENEFQVLTLYYGQAFCNGNPSIGVRCEITLVHGAGLKALNPAITSGIEPNQKRLFRFPQVLPNEGGDEYASYPISWPDSVKKQQLGGGNRLRRRAIDADSGTYSGGATSTAASDSEAEAPPDGLSGAESIQPVTSITETASELTTSIEPASEPTTSEPASEPTETAARRRPVRSVPQMYNLRSTIVDLNAGAQGVYQIGGKPQPPAPPPNLKEFLPAGDVEPYPTDKTRLAHRYFLGPSIHWARRLLEALIENGYALDVDAEEDFWTEIWSNEWVALTANNDIANHASIVTLYEHRYLAGVPPKPRISMLFTGDAYGYDLCHSLLERVAHPGDNARKEEVDILKVPHHGSAKTVDGLFYERVRASVYIVCAKPAKNNNPTLASLRAIVEGFKGRTTPSGQPFYIFFSDPGILGPDTDNKHDQVRVLRQGIPPNNDYKYEMYAIQPISGGSDPRGTSAFASLLFGRDINGNLVTQFSAPQQWVRIAP